MSAMFSVAIDDADPPAWTIVCDRCGQQLDASMSPLTIFKIEGLNEMYAKNPFETERRLKDMRDRMTRSPVFIDSRVEVVTIPQGLQERLFAHKQTCQVTK